MEFEEKVSELEELALKLESGALGLEESIALYGQSLELTKACLQDLQAGKEKLTVLKKQMDELFDTPVREEDI